MSKHSGYQIKVTAFIEASPKDMEQMRLAIQKIEAVCSVMRGDGFLGVKHDTRFMLSKEIETGPIVVGATGSGFTAEVDQDALAIPAALDRSKRA